MRLLHGGVPPLEVVCIGALLSLPAIPFLCRPEDRWWHALTASSPGVWLARGTLATLSNLGSVVAFTRLSMPEAFAVIFLMPAFVTMLSRLLLHEEVRWRRWLAVALGFAGVLIVLRPGVRAVGFGHAAAVLCALSAAASVVMLRALGPRERPVSLYGAGLVGPIVASGSVAAATGLVWPTGEEWLLLLGYGMLGAIATVLYQVSARAAPAAVLAPTQYSQMLWAIGFGAFVFDDPPDRLTYVGAAVIVASGLLTLLRERVRDVPRAADTPAIRPPK